MPTDLDLALNLPLPLVQVEVGGLLEGVLREHGLRVAHVLELEVARRDVAALVALYQDAGVLRGRGKRDAVFTLLGVPSFARF